LFDVNIQNIVVAFQFEPPLNLENIRKTFQKECFFETIEDKRYTFRVVALRTRKPRFTFLIYRTGKIICTGSKNINEAKRSDMYLLKRFHQAGINASLKAEAQVQNIVATACIKDQIDLEKLLTHLYKDKHYRVLYEPDQFPGAIIKFKIYDKRESTILLFSAGKLVCVGLTEFEEIKEAIRIIASKAVF